MEEGSKVITLVITLDNETGALSVNGPMADKVLCLGLLELAKDVVKDFSKDKEGRKQ